MAEPPARALSWDSLPMDVLREIVSRLPCPVDRGRAQLVCRWWRRSLTIPKLPSGRPRPLPWLLLPAAAAAFPFPASGGGGSTFRVACVLSGCRAAHHLLTVTPRGARCFGSLDGGWLFLAFRDPFSHQLLNARTGGVRALPGVLLGAANPRDPYDRQGLPAHGRAMEMLAAAGPLLAPPAPQGQQADRPRYAAAGIVVTRADGDGAPLRRVALWFMGHGHAIDIGSASGIEDLAASPFAHYSNDGGSVSVVARGFLFLNSAASIGLAIPEAPQPDQGGVLRPVARRHFWRFVPCPGDVQFLRARYLLFSRGELLMVVRFTPRADLPWTSEFKVFVAAVRQVPDDGADPGYSVADYPWAWRELHTLGGRMLLLGRGCSRSYEVDQYPGFSDAIYFFDDGEFYFYSFANGDAYRCSDNGVWSEGRVQRCFPRSGPSGHSPPAWLLP